MRLDTVTCHARLTAQHWIDDGRLLFKAGSISWSSGPNLFGTDSNCAAHASKIADLVCNKNYRQTVRLLPF